MTEINQSYLCKCTIAIISFKLSFTVAWLLFFSNEGKFSFLCTFKFFLSNSWENVYQKKKIIKRQKHLVTDRTWKNDFMELDKKNLKGEIIFEYCRKHETIIISFLLFWRFYEQHLGLLLRNFIFLVKNGLLLFI